MVLVTEGQRLLENRNRNIGAMFAAEKAADYVAILYRLTEFRRNHELEPLREDVIAACDMSPEDFAPLMNQLLDWELVDSRIEKERLRGYRDTRLNKFRYKISHEAESFIEWLEDLQREDLMPEDVDPRGKMDDLLGTLRELERHINTFSGEACTNENARTLCHGLSRLEQVMDELSRSLSELEARLIAFTLAAYNVSEVAALIDNLKVFNTEFARSFASRISQTREIAAKLIATRLDSRWTKCKALMDEQQRRTSGFIRMREIRPIRTLNATIQFLSPDGALSKMLERVRTSGRKLWQRLYSHLNEVTRRSHRREDLAARLKDLAALPVDAVPHEWILSVFAPASMRGDANAPSGDVVWRASPPMPVLEKRRIREQPSLWLEERAPDPDGVEVRSLEETRREALRAWMHERGFFASESSRLSSARVDGVEDFARVVEIMRSGILGEGARLARIGAHAHVLEGEDVVIRNDASELSFEEIEIVPIKGGTENDG